jgi:hypothetical protein
MQSRGEGRLVNLRIFALAGVLLLVVQGCASARRWQSESATAPGADIAAYASFGWLSAADGPGESEAPLSIADANLRNAIRSQLVEKGYREVEQNPDLRIGFETATRAKEKTAQPIRIGVGMGSWSGNVGGSVDASVPVGSEGVTTIAEIRITIRALDPSGNREVWVGSATGEVQQGLDAAVVEKAVDAVLEDFPARRR